MRLYLDSSAIVKLVQSEPESLALARYLRGRDRDMRVTSDLARVEVVRAVARGGAGAVAAARRQLEALHRVALGRDLLDDAATLAPGAPLRSLDAVHLATARLLGAELAAVVTYDERMAGAAEALGLAVESPA